MDDWTSNNIAGGRTFALILRSESSRERMVLGAKSPVTDLYAMVWRPKLDLLWS